MPEPLSKGDQSRTEILAAARRLFLSQGYHGTSMRAIALEAGGRAVAGLYNHFPTKEAIFQALIQETNPYDELFGALEGALEGVTTAPEFLRRALVAVLDVIPRYFDFFQITQIDIREFEARTITGVLQDQVLPRVLGLIARLQALPGFRPIDPVIWMRLMGSLVIGFMVTDQLGGMEIFQQYTHAEWGQFLAEALLYGVADPDYE